MLPNMHPADELSLLREEMRRLRMREAELQSGFLAGTLPRNGTIARVNLQVQRRRVLRREQLPSDIQCDPRYWQTRERRIILIEEQTGIWEEDPDLDDGTVIEPFDA